MKYTGFVATYAPEGKKNKHNYFFNGIGKDDVSESDSAMFCDSSKRRNLFAVSDASNSEVRGAEAAFISIDILRDFVGSEFSKTNLEYLIHTNEVIKGRVFEENGKTVCTDMGILYINHDTAYVYNIGDVPVFYYEPKKHLKKLSGEISESVEVETVTTDKNGEIVLKSVEKGVIPYIGYMSDEYVVKPHISEKLMLKDKDIFLLASRSVLKVLRETEIEKVLADSKLEPDEKTKKLIDMAVKADADGNYTVQLIEVKGGKKIGAFKISTAVIAAVLVILIGFASVFDTVFINGINNMTLGFKSLVNSFMQQFLSDEKTEEEADPWIPLRKEEPEETLKKPEIPETEPETEAVNESNKQSPQPKQSKAATQRVSRPMWSKPAVTAAPSDANVQETSDAENSSENAAENSEIENPPEESMVNENTEEETEMIIEGEAIEITVPPYESGDAPQNSDGNNENANN